jgi:hypothetical protein
MGRRWTVREVAEHVSIGGIGPVIAGWSATVADQLEQWIEDTGLDGFNMAFAVRGRLLSMWSIYPFPNCNAVDATKRCMRREH